MNLLVCISKAPDTTAKISFTNDNTEFNTEGVQFIINPYDEWYALVRALELKEANGGEVTVICVDEAEADSVIRKALAIGADKSVRINAKPTDACFVAKQIAEYAKDKNFDMILTGKETIDYNGSQVGGMVAESLELPYVSLASKMDMEGNTASVQRDIQGGKEYVEVDTPFVLSAAKGMAEARIPNMRGIMAARSKPLEVIEPVEVAKHTEVKTYDLPPEKGDCKYVDPENVEELVDLLHNEAKAI